MTYTGKEHRCFHISEPGLPFTASHCSHAHLNVSAVVRDKVGPGCVCSAAHHCNRTPLSCAPASCRGVLGILHVRKRVCVRQNSIPLAEQLGSGRQHSPGAQRTRVRQARCPAQCRRRAAWWRCCRAPTAAPALKPAPPPGTPQNPPALPARATPGFTWFMSSPFAFNLPLFPTSPK